MTWLFEGLECLGWCNHPSLCMGSETLACDRVGATTLFVFRGVRLLPVTWPVVGSERVGWCDHPLSVLGSETPQ